MDNASIIIFKIDEERPWFTRLNECQEFTGLTEAQFNMLAEVADNSDDYDWR